MTYRALLWCGQADPARRFDFPASVRDLDLAVRAARKLGVRGEDIYAFLCRGDLLPEGLGESHYYPATVRALERVLAQISRSASAEDALLFVATNHGIQRGLITSATVDEFAEEEGSELLTPQTLRQCLDRLPGAQVLAFATCHAGIFLPLGQAGRAVLACCAADQRYIVQEDPPCSPFLIELFKAWCGAELPGYETGFASKVAELSAAFAQAEQQLTSSAYPAEYKRLSPLMQGEARWPAPR